jgi:hypothetical protein
MLDMMDIMNKEKYGFVNPKTEMSRFKWVMYKYYKIHIEEPDPPMNGFPYSESLYRIRYNNYTEYLEKNLSRFRFIRGIKNELLDIYDRRLNQFYEKAYHPDNVNELTDRGLSFSEAINTIDRVMETTRVHYN